MNELKVQLDNLRSAGAGLRAMGGVHTHAQETLDGVERSQDGSVVVSTFGMSTWTAHVEASALTGAEEDFVRSAGEAMSAALADRLPRLRKLAASARAGRL